MGDNIYLDYLYRSLNTETLAKYYQHSILSVSRRRLRSVDSPTLLVPSTRRSTLGDRAFPVAAARAWKWNSLPPQTRAASSILTYRRETKSHLFRQSFGWRRSAGWHRFLLTDSALSLRQESCNIFIGRLCKVPPQWLWWRHLNLDICSSSSSSSSTGVFRGVGCCPNFCA